jgi:hypothetical protein
MTFFFNEKMCTHSNFVKAEVLKAIGKDVGDLVIVVLEQQMIG